MPSLLHEEILDLLREAPDVLLEALRASGAITLPPFSRAEVRPGEIRELLPTERRIDLLVLLLDDTPVLALPIEIQQSIDRRKRRLWPFVVTSIALTHDCDAVLIVVTTHPAVASWARGPFSVGHPGTPLRPIVIGPTNFPFVTDHDEARRAPHRAILSVLMHRDLPEVVPVVEAAFASLERLDPHDADQWRELLAHALQSNELARAAVESIMSIENFRDKSAWYREGLELGWRQGEELGLQRGHQTGVLETARHALLRVLSRRDLPLTDEHRERIETCDDAERLGQWLDQAITATSADEALR